MNMNIRSFAWPFVIVAFFLAMGFLGPNLPTLLLVIGLILMII